jgi:hypothetical protein
MPYFIDLFSPETYEAFARSGRDISGFRLRHKGMADRIKSGDVFVCYLTRLSRWFGLLEVVEGPFIDDKPIFVPENDPFVVRFRVRPLVWLEIEKAIPIHDDAIWTGLSFTRGLERGSIAWTGKVRGSLVRLDDRDGKFLAEKLTAQSTQGKAYPLDEQDTKKLATHTVNRPDKVVTVSVPEDSVVAGELSAAPEAETRESIRVQALIAQIGARMGLSIWIPRADRGGVLKEWKDGARTFWNAYRLTTTTPLFERSNRSMFSGFAAGRSFVHSRSSIRRRSTPAFYGWPTCSRFNPIWTSSCTLLRLERNARRFSKRSEGPCFPCWRKAPSPRAALIFHMTACASSAHRST